MVIKQRYGTWDSAITAEAMATGSIGLSQVVASDTGTYWVEQHATANARNVLIQHTDAAGSIEVLPQFKDGSLPNVGTRVHEYGGKSYAVSEGLIVFSHLDDNLVYCYNLNEPQAGLIPLTNSSLTRYGDFEINLSQNTVYAVCEDHSAGEEPRNYLVAIPLDGRGAQVETAIEVIFARSDFVVAPTLSPDKSKLAWITWNHPHMPWQQSALKVAEIQDNRLINEITLVNENNVAVCEPRWTMQGDLIHIDDSSGWLNLYRTEGFSQTGSAVTSASQWQKTLRTRRLHPGNRNFSQPAWQLGLHSYDVLDNEHLICSWVQDGFWQLGTVRLDNGQLEPWSVGWWPLGNISVANGKVFLLADNAHEPAAIIEVSAGVTKVLRSSTNLQLESTDISTAKAISWPTSDGDTCHGFFYPPVNSRFIGADFELPPLVVMAHGGPTSASRPGFNLGKQFWTSRGFAVLDVNYRGSSGWDRNYTDKLQGRWGITDVNDCNDGVKYLVQHGIVDGKRVAIRGGSAGGFTVLAALVSADVYTAGTSLYGVADLALLAAETHKFESRYLEGLLGTADLEDPVFTERSPIHQIDQITAPLLLLQGEDDKVVPPSQAKTMYAALQARHHPVELVIYPQEGHGFRKAANIIDAYQKELDFYLKTWGL
ncbi:S9 family peptidase [Gleimia sp. 6138-11-ORH1]|uniref:alpha/beta hydrolase family protein n=1 Tax=Gleimia sp. 6138-11-ORH1 TaxID=2973937 RepID=UPI0021695DFB|nr:S9 family peptidase [Gleimia sp. 6138-11-ORH1]MCS4484423.1 S9 family peptidase [Gleimia sp. 6138-11-ORH1]